MASDQKPREGAAAPKGEDTGNGPAASSEALLPFQEASERYLAAKRAAAEAAAKRQAEFSIDLQQKAWEIEQGAYRALFEASKASVGRFGDIKGSPEEQALAFAKLQFECEIQARQIEFDTHAKLRSLAEASTNDPSGATGVVEEFTKRHQEAYQAYLGDLQKAWSRSEGMDPGLVSAAAATILSTMSAASC